MRSSTVAGLLLGLLAVAPASAVAAPPPEETRAAAKEHFLKGTTAYDVGKYEEAIKEYIAAYEITNDPVFLYNIAQAHRLAEHAPEALRFYKNYLAKVPEARNRAEVQTKIEELQKLVDQAKRTRELPPDHALTSESGTTPNNSNNASEVLEVVERGAGKVKKIVGLVVAVVGVGLVVGGAVCGVLAKTAGDQLTQLDRSHLPFDAAKESAGKTDVILEGVFLGVGAAAVVAGVAMFAIGQSEKRYRRVALLPVLAPTTAGATLRVAF